MEDFFWLLATSYFVLGLIATIALAALIVGHIPFGKYALVIGPYVVLARFVAYPALMLLAFLIGWRMSSERAQVRQLKIDLAFAQVQLSNERAAAADAARLRSAAERAAEELNVKVADYEKTLRDSPGAVCALDDGDIDSLRRIAR